MIFGQSHHSRIEVLQIAQLLVVIFVSVSLVRENLRGLRENLKHKIRTWVLRSSRPATRFSISRRALSNFGMYSSRKTAKRQISQHDSMFDNQEYYLICL